MLTSSPHLWRIIWFQTRCGRTVEFLTKDFDLQPSVVAFFYSRRWEEERCFDTWKNDFTQAKACGKSPVTIENQVRLAIVPGIVQQFLICPYPVFGRPRTWRGVGRRPSSITSNRWSQESKGRY